jgi:hypothetical protein
MKATILLVICLFGFACTKQNSDEKEKQDSLEPGAVLQPDTTRRPVGINPGEARSLLQGIWAPDEESNALFQIKGDSLYYFEDPEPVYFEVKADSFKVLIEGKFFSSKILKLDGDSLIRIEYKKVIKLYKRK